MQTLKENQFRPPRETGYVDWSNDNEGKKNSSWLAWNVATSFVINAQEDGICSAFFELRGAQKIKQKSRTFLFRNS